MKFDSKKIISGLILGAIIFSIVAPILFLPKPTQAQLLSTDIPHIAMQVGKWILQQAGRLIDIMRETGEAVFFKNVLNEFLQKMAEESAIFLATGGTEGKPLFFTDKEYYTKMADSVAGNFLDQVAKDFTGHGLCEPIDPTLKLSILLSLPVPKPAEVFKIEERCSLSDIKENLIAASKKSIAEFSYKIQPGGEAVKFNTTLKTMIDLGKFVNYVSARLTILLEIRRQLLDLINQYSNVATEVFSYLKTGTPVTIEHIKALNELDQQIRKKIEEFEKSATEFESGLRDCQSLALNDFCTKTTCLNFCQKQTSSYCRDNFEACLAETRKTLDWLKKTKDETSGIVTDYEKIREMTQHLGSPTFVSPTTPQILEDLQKKLSPEGNPLGQIGKLTSTLGARVSQEIENSKFFQILRGEWKPPETTVSKIPFAPAETTAEQAREMVKAGTASPKIYTGVALADAIGVFTNTLFKKLFDNLLQGRFLGLSFAPEATYSSKTWEELFRRAGQPQPSTSRPVCGNGICENGETESNCPADCFFIRGERRVGESESPLPSPTPKEIRAIYADVLSTPLKKGEVIRLIDEFSQCPSDPRYALPNNCVVDTAFARAVEEELTIEEAMKKNYLHPEWAVSGQGSHKITQAGVIDETKIVDTRRDFSSRYSYTNIKILAQAGIVPLGLQIAAEKISQQDLPEQFKNKIFTLKEIVDDFDKAGQDGQCGTNDKGESPFCGLVNPKWRLKDFPRLCQMIGYTAIPLPNSAERQEACLQSQDCTQENNDGTCNTWNYCTAYRNSWRFNADRCEAQYDSCQLYTRTKDRARFTWLEKSLDYNDCDASSIGCQWYCRDYNPTLGQAGLWSCARPGVKYEQCILPHTKGGRCPATGQKLCDVQPGSTYCFYEVPAPENVLFFNRQVETCSATAEGCVEFIRTKENLGTNLLPNSSFETYSGTELNVSVKGWNFSKDETARPTGKFTFDETKAYAGKVFAEFTQAGSLFPSPDGAKIVLLPETTYTVSLLARNNNQNYSRHLTVSISGVAEATKTWELAKNSPWQIFSYEFPSLPSYKKISDLRISSNDADVLIDNIFLTTGTSSFYTDYGSRNLVYLKKAPNYLACYNRDNNGKLKEDDDSPNCLNFLKACNQTDVGCEKYTPVTGEPYIPAVAKDKDRCPAECVGYNSFREITTEFYPSRNVDFIPRTGRTCPANEVACDGYTNLEEVRRGGEGREFYSYVRACQKPDNDCANFYIWVGSEVRGYELKKYFLRKDIDGTPGQILPLAKAEEIWGKCQGPEDARTNPNCREFYDENGRISYRLYKNTITCHESCLQLRKNKPISASLCWPTLFKNDNPLENKPLIEGLSFTTTGGESCLVLEGSQRCLTPNKEVCDLGKICRPEVPKGEFGSDLPTCPCYTGICTLTTLPAESVRCSASNDGCREYKGNDANNIKISFLDNFENGTFYPWQALADSKLSYSNDSIYFGGHSLKIQKSVPAEEIGEVEASNSFKIFAKIFKTKTAEAQDFTPNLGAARPLSGLIAQGKSYLLSLLVKGNVNNQKISAKFSSNAAPFAEAVLTREWQLINLGPVYLDKLPDADEKLEIFSNSTFWLDYIQLRDTGSLYLIRNSWLTPTTCQDQGGNPVMIGCAEYRDRENKPNFLKSFSRLCSESAIGCEALINTQNSFSPFQEKFNNDKPPTTDDVTVAADETEYLIYDKTFSCQTTDKGCQKLGLPNLVDNQPTTWSEVYLKNNPDFYTMRPILCRETQQNCEEFTTNGGGTVYLKDPGEKQCQWRENVVISNERKTGWFKQGTDQACYENYLPDGLTYGLKLRGEENYLGYAGLCPENKVGCKKFVDPLATANVSYLKNGDFKQPGAPPPNWFYSEACNSTYCKAENEVLKIDVPSPQQLNPNNNIYRRVYTTDQIATVKAGLGASYFLKFKGKIERQLGKFDWAGAMVNLNYQGIKTHEELDNCQECSDWQEYKNNCQNGNSCRTWIKDHSPRNCLFAYGNLKSCIAWLIDLGFKPWVEPWVNGGGDGLNAWAWNYVHGYINSVNVNLDKNKTGWQELSLSLVSGGPLNPKNYPLDSLTVRAILSPPRWEGCNSGNNDPCENPNQPNPPWKCCSASGIVIFDNFELKPFDPYYLLDNFKLKKGECRNVSLEEDCVLFYDETAGEPIYNSVATYKKSADLNGAAVPPIDCTKTPFPSQISPEVRQETKTKSLFLAFLKKIFSPFLIKDVRAILGGLSASCASPDYKNTDYCKYCHANGQTQNDTNLILKVDSTRVCAEWLHCEEYEKIWVKEISDYLEVCKNAQRCNRQIGQGKEAKCVSFSPPSFEVLTEDVYKKRDTSWFGLEPGGYSLYNFRPVEKLNPNLYNLNLGADIFVYDQLMLTYLAKEGTIEKDQGVSQTCSSDDECPAGAGCFYETGQRQQGKTVISKSKTQAEKTGICLIPLSSQAAAEKDAPFSPVLSKTFANVNLCERGFFSCSDLSAETCENYRRYGCEAQSGVCKIAYRTYIYNVDQLKCEEQGGKWVYCKETYCPYWTNNDYGDYTAGENACNHFSPHCQWANNKCEYRNAGEKEEEKPWSYFACQGSYKKAEYGLGGSIKKYFNQIGVDPWPGICLNAKAPKKVGDPCNPDDVNRDQCGLGGTTGCERLTKETTYLGRSNFCLSQDLSRPNAQITKACLLWYPLTYTLLPKVTTVSASPSYNGLNPIVTFKGYLNSLGASSGVKVWFEWQESSGTNWQKIGEQTRTEVGEFTYIDSTTFNYNTDYKFRAGAENPHGIAYGGISPTFRLDRREFDFNLSLSSSGGMVAPGGAVSTTITVTQKYPESSSESVSFSATITPPSGGNTNDIIISFNPLSCTPSGTPPPPQTCSSLVNISALSSAQIGDYTIIFRGAWGERSHSIVYTLTVGGVCEGDRSCRENDKCNLPEGQRSGFYCVGAVQGNCNGNKNWDKCWDNEECEDYWIGPCLLPQGICSLDWSVICSSDLQCYEDYDCKNVIEGQCESVPDVCDPKLNNLDCPYNMYCECDYGPCVNNRCQKDPELGHYCNNHDDCKIECLPPP